jgi:hypothetical protein
LISIELATSNSPHEKTKQAPGGCRRTEKAGVRAHSNCTYSGRQKPSIEGMGRTYLGGWNWFVGLILILG